MSKAKRGGLIAFLVVLGTAGASILRARSFTNGIMPLPLAAVRNLPITLADGRRAFLGDRLRPGGPTVIALWASWCGPCRREASKMAEIERRISKDRLNFVYLNVLDDDASADDLKQYRIQFGMAADSYVVMNSKTLPELTRDKANLIPRTYAFDRQGAPIAMIVGYKPLALARIQGLVGA